MDADRELFTPSRNAATVLAIVRSVFAATSIAPSWLHARMCDTRPRNHFDRLEIRCLAVAFTVCVTPASWSPAAAADKFQRLSGPQLAARLPGMEITDEVHWADVYERGGVLKAYSMGRKTVGKWSIQKDELCLERGKEAANCYQVWNSGSKIELRRGGSDLPLQGILQKPSKRN